MNSLWPPWTLPFVDDGVGGRYEMRIYLDCCSLQRPFDDRSQPRIAVEAEAVLAILSLCESGRLILLASDILHFEISKIPDYERKEDALVILKMAKESISLTLETESLAREFLASGIKPLDSLHLASASLAQADYFCTSDNKFFKKANAGNQPATQVVSSQ
jgi:predicted nucleic acid-binding protein